MKILHRIIIEFIELEKIYKKTNYKPKMFKLILSLLCMAALVHAQCPVGSTKFHGNQMTNYCYRYIGQLPNYAQAQKKCTDLNLKLVTPTNEQGLDDLFKLYKGYLPNYFFWVGAESQVR